MSNETGQGDIKSSQGIILYIVSCLPEPGVRMDASSNAFVLIVTILAGVLTLTSIGIYFSFGPGSRSLIDPWEIDDD